MLPLLCVFIALATRCYCNTNTVVVGWSPPDRVPWSSAWKGLAAPLVPLPSVMPMPKLLWGWHGEPWVKGQVCGWYRSIGCCGEAKTTSRNRAPTHKRRVCSVDSMVCVHLRMKYGRGKWCFWSPTVGGRPITEGKMWNAAAFLSDGSFIDLDRRVQD